MSKNWLYISLTIFVALLLVLGSIIYSGVKSLEFEVNYAGSTTSIKSWKDIEPFLKGQGAVTLKFNVGVTNKSWFKIPIRDLETRVFYKGNLVGNTAASSQKNIDISPGSYKQWIEAVDIHSKGSTIKEFLTEIFRGGDPIIEYETELRVLGIRYTYSERVKVIETTLSQLS